MWLIPSAITAPGWISKPGPFSLFLLPRYLLKCSNRRASLNITAVSVVVSSDRAVSVAPRSRKIDPTESRAENSLPYTMLHEVQAPPLLGVPGNRKSIYKSLLRLLFTELVGTHEKNRKRGQ